MLLSLAAPASASDGGSGNGAPAAVRKACLKKVDKRAANVARLANKAAKSKWVTGESAVSLAGILEADLATIAGHRSAVQRAPWGEELLEACRVAFGGTRSIVAVDVRKLGIMVRTGRVDALLADLQSRLGEIVALLEVTRADAGVGEETDLVAVLSDALAQVRIDAVALVAEALAIAPSEWESGSAQEVLAGLREEATALEPVLGGFRSAMAALEALLGV